MKFYFILFSLFIGCQSLLSQQPAYFFFGENELEGAQIYDIIQDNDLNYWFATDQGFYKFDSYTFEKVDCKGMKGLSAFGFVKNKQGVIFCHNLNNQIFKIENNVCTIFYELKENERSFDLFLAITSNNLLLILSKNVVLLDTNGNQVKHKSVPSRYYGYPFLASNGLIFSHMADRDSILIVDKSEVRFATLNYTSEKIKGVLMFFKIDGQTYAVANVTKDLYAFNENSMELKRIGSIPRINTKEYIRFYYENNQLWLAGIKSGVSYLKEVAQIELSEAMYTDYLISNVFKDSEGNMLFSTFNHGVLVVPNLQIPDVLPALKTKPVLCLEKDTKFGILMGTIEGQLLSFKNNEYKILSNNGIKPLQSIYSWPNFPYIIFDDGQIKAYNKSSGQITVIASGSLKDATLIDDKMIGLALNTGIRRISFDSENNFKIVFSNDFITRTYSIAKEPINNSIYVATSEGLKISKVDMTVENVKLNNENIFANDITIDSKSVYVSTKNNGIVIFNNDKIIQCISPMLNQKKIEIYKLSVHDNKLYTLTSEGLIVFDRKGEVLIQLNKVQGFSTKKIFDFEIMDDQLWISHSKGLQKLAISQLNDKIETPLIKLSKIVVNDLLITDMSITKNFTYDQRKFKFTVSSPTLRNRENIKYHYILHGYEEKWMISNFANNEFIYNALAPGNYTFVIKAENQGKFSSPISYSFSILKPLYLRWWFIICVGLLLILLISMIFWYMLNAQRKKSQIINELNDSKLTAIRSQMNPHFIFNALNSIQDLVLKGDIDNSYTFITKFSNLIRRTLNYSDKDFVDFEQEIKLLELYLSLEKLRFKKELEYSIDVDIDADIQIPPLLIQPFVENALVHGLLHKEGNKKLSIQFHMEESLICIIEDNGVGRDKAKAIKLRQKVAHESFASKAIQKRFEILTNVMNSKFGYAYEDLYENDIALGTRVTLTIPVKHKY